MEMLADSTHNGADLQVIRPGLMLLKSTKLQRIALFVIVLVLFSAMPLSAQDNPPEETPPVESTEEPAAPPTAMPTVTRPEPSRVIKGDGATLELLFDRLKQGRVGVLHVTGDDVAGARLRLRQQLAEFYPVEDDGFYGLVAINIDQPPRVYDFSVLVWFEDGSEIVIPAQVEVILGGFIRQDFDLNQDRSYLADPQVERSELARINSVIDDVTLEHYWSDGGFQLPIVSELTSPFGAFRILNESVETRHTGWDLKATLGTPVMAMGAGTVAYAGLMDIRGNYVVIDHGYGIYSGFAHMSQVHVTRGQAITRGQIIGRTGDTGRSNGPHAHWEMTVNGEWVDPVDFILTWIP